MQEFTVFFAEGWVMLLFLHTEVVTAVTKDCFSCSVVGRGNLGRLGVWQTKKHPEK